MGVFLLFLCNTGSSFLYPWVVLIARYTMKPLVRLPIQSPTTKSSMKSVNSEAHWVWNTLSYLSSIINLITALIWSYVVVETWRRSHGRSLCAWNSISLLFSGIYHASKVWWTKRKAAFVFWENDVLTLAMLNILFIRLLRFVNPLTMLHPCCYHAFSIRGLWSDGFTRSDGSLEAIWSGSIVFQIKDKPGLSR